MGRDGGLQVDAQRGLVRAESGPRDRRAAGRAPVEHVRSTLGPVLDLSVSGMRIQAWDRLPKAPLVIRLALEGEPPILLTGVVAWSRSRLFGKTVAGVRFVDVAPATRRRIIDTLHSARCVPRP